MRQDLTALGLDRRIKDVTPSSTYRCVEQRKASMKAIMSMRDALEHPDIFGTMLAGESWAAWRVLLIAVMGEELTNAERDIFCDLTGATRSP